MDNLQTQIRSNPHHHHHHQQQQQQHSRLDRRAGSRSSSQEPSVEPIQDHHHHRSNSTLSSSSVSSYESDSPPSSAHPSIDQPSDPLQRWFIFSPPSSLPQPILDPHSTHHQPHHPSSDSVDSLDHPFEFIPSSSSSSLDSNSHHHHLICSPSMPTHDGRGRFLNSNDPSISSLPPSSSSSSSPSSSSSSHQDHLHLDYSHLNHLSYSPSPLGSSIVSLSNTHSGQDDDLLSIPSSLSITLSGSRRSSTDSDLNLSLSINRRSSFQERMSLADDHELMLTPMAISAGICTPHGSMVASHHQPSHPSSQSSHHSSAIRGLASRRKSDSRQPTTHHRPSRCRARIRPASSRRSSSSKRPPLIPSDRSTSHPHPHLGLNINHIVSHHHNSSLINLSRQASIKFLANVAIKLLDLDADTIKMLNASDLNPPYTPQSRLANRISPLSKSQLQIKNRRLAKFSIGDGDHRRSSSQLDDDTINSPLDISAFAQPTLPSSSPLTPASWEIMHESQGESYEGEDDDQTEVEDDGEMRRTFRGRRRQMNPRNIDGSKIQPRRFRSRSSRGDYGDDHIELGSSTRRSVSDSDLKLFDHDHEQDPELAGCESRHHPPNPSHSSSTSSMAGILLKRVLDEWTNW